MLMCLLKNLRNHKIILSGSEKDVNVKSNWISILEDLKCMQSKRIGRKI